MSARAVPPDGQWRPRTLAILGLVAILAAILLIPLGQLWIHAAGPTPSLQPGDGLLVLEFDHVPQASTTSGVTAYITVLPSPADDPLSALSAQRLAAPARASLELPAGPYEIQGSTQTYGPGPSGIATEAPDWACTKQVTLTEGETLTVSMMYDIGTCTMAAR